jgi:hypothetical protein
MISCRIITAYFTLIHDHDRSDTHPSWITPHHWRILMTSFDQHDQRLFTSQLFSLNSRKGWRQKMMVTKRQKMMVSMPARLFNNQKPHSLLSKQSRWTRRYNVNSSYDDEWNTLKLLTKVEVAVATSLSYSSITVLISNNDTTYLHWLESLFLVH